MVSLDGGLAGDFDDRASKCLRVCNKESRPVANIHRERFSPAHPWFGRCLRFPCRKGGFCFHDMWADIGTGVKAQAPPLPSEPTDWRDVDALDLVYPSQLE